MEDEIGTAMPRHKLARWHATLLIVILAPIAVVVGFLWRLGVDLYRAFPAAWLEAGMEWESVKRHWREERIR